MPVYVQPRMSKEYRRASNTPTSSVQSLSTSVNDHLVTRLSKISQLYTAEQRQKGLLDESFPREITAEDDMNDFFAASDPLVWDFLEEKSLGYFTLENPIRRVCVNILLSSVFTWTIFFCICVNAVLLAMDNPLSSKGDNFFAIAELFFNILFTTEFIIKIIALSGFGQIGGYYRDAWNKLDFLVLIVSWIPLLIPGSTNFSFIRIMRSFKVMKTFNNVPGLKRMVALFANVVPKLASLVYLLGFVFLFFGVFGGQLFRGNLRQHCFPEDSYSTSLGINDTALLHYQPTDELCTLSGRYSGGQVCPTETPKCTAFFPQTDNAIPNPHENKYLNFDNTLFSFLTIFVVISLEGWTDIMFSLADASGYVSEFYFVVLVVIGSFFLVNLVVAVVYNAYLSTFEDHISANVEKYLQKVYKKKVKREAKRASHSSVIRILDSWGMVPKRVVHFFHESNGYLKFKAKVRKLVTSSIFIIVINAVILYNMITLAIEVNGTSEKALEYLYYSNILCIVVFIIELLLRLISLSIVYFFYSWSNIFDAFIVVFGVLELFYLKTGSSITVLRTMRLFRLIKLMKQWKSLQQFIECIVRCTRGLGPFFVILCLFLFICTLSGMSLFAGKFDHENDVFESRANFDTFFLSFVTTFQIMSGENWNSILLTSMDHDPYKGAIYCVLIYSLGFVIVLNVFLAVMLESFSTRYDDGISYYDLLEDQYSLKAFVKRVKFLYKKILSCFITLPEPEETVENEESDGPPRPSTILRQRGGSGLVPVKTNPDSQWDGWEQYKSIERLDNLSAKFIEDELFCRKTLEQIPLSSYRQGDFKVQRNCFTGAELVDFLMDERIVSNTEEAICMGQELLFMKKIEAMHIWDDDETSATPPTIKPSFSRQNSLSSRPPEDPKFGDNRSLFRLGMIGRQVTEWLATSNDIEEEIKLVEANKIVLQRQKILEGCSFGIFESDDKFRIFCVDLVTSTMFDNGIIVLILISICLIASEDPSGEGSDVRLKVFFILDVLFTVLFTIEMLLKMVAHGVIQTQMSYFSSNWNRLDFAIVTISLLSLSVKTLNLDYLKVFRVMRALRPLRLVSHSPELKAAFNAIILITKPLLSFVLVVNVFLLTFAILMTSLYRDKLQFCHTVSDDVDIDIFEHRYELDRADCMGSYMSESNSTVTLEWRSVDSNFDSVSNSFLTLYEMITMDNWPNIMYPAMDINRQNHHPIRNKTQYNALVFILFIIIGAFCIGNVLVGIVVNKFSRSIQMGKADAFLSDDQQKWLDSMKIAMTAKPLRRLPIPEKDEMFGLKRPIYLIVADKYFQNGMDVVILMNMLSLTINYFDEPEEYSNGTFILEVIFSSIFLVEITLRFFAVKPREFFKVTWNVLDLLIVIGSLVGIFATSSTINVSIFRLFRIGRILRLVKKSKNLTILVKTLHLSTFSLVNIGLLLMLSLFVFSIVGMHLFWDVDIDGKVLTNHQNFKSLGVTMLLLFRCITGEGWTTIMHYLMDEGFQEISPLYFIIFLTVNQYVLLSLFVAVILNNFATALQYDPDKVNKRNLEDFINVWAEIHDELGSEDKEYYLPSYALVSLLQRTEAPLGIKNVTKDMVTDKDVDRIEYIVSLIHTLELKEDHAGRINFIDTVAALIRNLHKNNKSMKGEKYDGESMMSEDQKHELQVCLTKMCKTRLMDKIREGTKDLHFSDIDLAVVFNNAIVIQARWRGNTGRDRFVKMWHMLRPMSPLPKAMGHRFVPKEQLQKAARPSLMSKLFRLDSTQSSQDSYSLGSPGSGRGRRNTMHDMVKQSFNSLGSSFRSGPRSFSDNDDHSGPGKFSRFKHSPSLVPPEEMARLKALEEKRRTGRNEPTSNANIKDYVVNSSVIFIYKKPVDEVKMKISLLASRPSIPLTDPLNRPTPPSPRSPLPTLRSPPKATTRPLLFKKFTPEKQDEVVVSLQPHLATGMLSRELSFHRTKRNRSSYSILEEADESSTDHSANNSANNSAHNSLTRSKQDSTSSDDSVEDEVEVLSLDEVDLSHEDMFSTCESRWSASRSRSRSLTGSRGSSESGTPRRHSGSTKSSFNSGVLSNLTSNRSFSFRSSTDTPPLPFKPPLTAEMIAQKLQEEKDAEDARARRQMQDEAIARAQARKQKAVARIKAQEDERAAAAKKALKKEKKKARALELEKELRASARLKAKEDREAQRKAEIEATIARIEEAERAAALLREQEEEKVAAALEKAREKESIADALRLAKEEHKAAAALRKAQKEKMAQQQAEEVARLAAQRQAEEEARIAAQRQAEEEARIAAQRQAEEEARLADQRQAEEEARIAAQRQAEEEARLAAQRQAEEEARLAAERQAEEEKEKATVKAAEEERAIRKREKALAKEAKAKAKEEKARAKEEKTQLKRLKEEEKKATELLAQQQVRDQDEDEDSELDDPLALIIKAAEEEQAAAALLKAKEDDNEKSPVANPKILISQQSSLGDESAVTVSNAVLTKAEKAKRKEAKLKAKEEKARLKEEKAKAKLAKRLKKDDSRGKKENEDVREVTDQDTGVEEIKGGDVAKHISRFNESPPPPPPATVNDPARGGRGGIVRRLSEQQLSPFTRNNSSSSSSSNTTPRVDSSWRTQKNNDTPPNSFSTPTGGASRSPATPSKLSSAQLSPFSATPARRKSLGRYPSSDGRPSILSIGKLNAVPEVHVLSEDRNGVKETKLQEDGEGSALKAASEGSYTKLKETFNSPSPPGNESSS